MNNSELTKLTADIVTQYYDNHIEPFLESCHDEILWIGPAKGQLIQSKAALLEAFSKEEHKLRFSVQDMTATTTSLSKHFATVLLSFFVSTYWPDGTSGSVYQRATLTWELLKDKPMIRVCHISNAIDYDARDTIYPIHYPETHDHMTLFGTATDRIHFSGTEKSIFYTTADQIIFIESSGAHTLIHTTSQVYECTERLTAVAAKISKNFLRCHESYLINPAHVSSIERFRLTMTDGSIIPIPEKKYTAVKASLLHK